MKNDTHYLSSKTVSMLKQRARDLKRTTTMSHTQALESVAQGIGSGLLEGCRRCCGSLQTASRQAMQTGLVVAFDRKESPEPAGPAGNLVHWAFGLDPRHREDIRNWWADFAG